jgi:hypothetical protein
MSAWFIRSATTVARPIAVVPSTFVPSRLQAILPALLSRVEQGRRFLRERVDGANGIRLELIARSARQADVIEGRQSATRCWCDVM